MRALLTGGSGFVGSWLASHCSDEGDEVVLSTASLEDADALRGEVHEAEPEVILHLAGQADVGASWSDPVHTFTVNAVGTLHVLEAARTLPVLPRVLVVSSAEVYGRVEAERLPVRESLRPCPTSPYGVSKLAAEELALQAHRGWGLPVIVTRAFNHIGPRQSDRFVVSAIARQIAAAERSGASTLDVGNLTPRRDYTDVRDVVRAYRLLAERGSPGTVYNVCTGRARAVEEIVSLLLARSERPLDVRVDPARVRPVDVPLSVGDPGRLTADTGWQPRVAIEQTLDDVLAWWRSELDDPTASGSRPSAR